LQYGRTDRPDAFSLFAIGQPKTLPGEIDLVPSKAFNLAAAAAGQCEKAYGKHGRRICTLRLCHY
jgi:hypothetical protein